MEVTLHIPDDIAKRLSAAGGDVSRRALEAIALEGYRDQTLTLYQSFGDAESFPNRDGRFSGPTPRSISCD